MLAVAKETEKGLSRAATTDICSDPYGYIVTLTIDGGGCTLGDAYSE